LKMLAALSFVCWQLFSISNPTPFPYQLSVEVDSHLKLTASSTHSLSFTLESLQLSISYPLIIILLFFPAALFSWLLSQELPWCFFIPSLPVLQNCFCLILQDFTTFGDINTSILVYNLYSLNDSMLLHTPTSHSHSHWRLHY
jgi:hypothetical protein